VNVRIWQSLTPVSIDRYPDTTGSAPLVADGDMTDTESVPALAGEHTLTNE